MNFKILLMLIILFNFIGCGVKSRPANPPETAISSYINTYINPGNERPSKEDEQKKK